MADNEKKKEIRQKAAILFRERGYDNVTVNEISAAAGVSKNTFYYYYDNKEALIKAMFDPRNYDLDKVMGELLRYSDPYEQIICMCGLIADYFASLGREIVRKALVMNLSRTIMHPTHRDGNKEAHGPVCMVFQRAIEEGKIRSDVTVDMLMTGSTVILMGCLQMWSTCGQDMDLKDTYVEQMRLLLEKQPRE